MSDLVKFRIPADFVLDRLLPRVDELLYGYDHGWLIDEDVVAIALARYSRGVEIEQAEERLALLLASDLSQVDPIVQDLRNHVSDSTDGSEEKAWLYLCVAYVSDLAGEFDDPFQTIEMIYADFDYPDELRDFVRFLPPLHGEPAGIDGLSHRWHEYLTRAEKYYQERQT